MPIRLPRKGDWAMGPAWGILETSGTNQAPAVSDAAQLVLFAPYCGGVSREQDLSAALQILERGALQGRRPVAGSDGHPYELRWNGVAAPMGSLHRWRGWTVSFVFPVIPREI